MKTGLSTIAFCLVTALIVCAPSVALAQEATAPTPQPSTENPVAADQAAPAEAAPANEAASDAAAPPSETTSDIVGPPPAGKGLVVFFRPSRALAGAITFTAREGETILGRLASDHYFAVPVDPGIHEFDLRGGGSLRIEVEEGETSFLQVNIMVGLTYNGAFALSDKAAFEAHSLQLSRPPPPRD